MINNYYNIPNIPCDQRETITPSSESDSLSEKTLKCSGINPDSIYATLYPDDADPLSNYAAYNSKKLDIGKSILETVADTNKCAKDCFDNQDCTYFTIEKGENKCYLYGAKSTSKNTKFNSFLDKNTVKSWRKNDLLEGTTNCNINDAFIEQTDEYFPDVDSVGQPKFSQPNLSKNECLSSCLYDENCNSVVFMESKSNCAKYNINPNGRTAALSELTGNNLKSAPGATTYLKNEVPIGNRFDAPEGLSEYYKTYTTSGKVGDSFCEFVDNKCLTSYIVGPDNNKEVPSKNAENAKKIPAPKLCMPPTCIPNLPNTGLKGKLKVNGDFNIMCPEGAAGKQCEKDITKTQFASFDHMGLPTNSGTSNPPNSYIPYSAQYNSYNNLGLPESYEMNEGEKPPLGGMDFSEDCQSWCNKSIDCGGYSYYFGDDGKSKCKYYKNNGMNELKKGLNYLKDTTTFIKRGNPYIQKPLTGNIKKPYFNNLSTYDTDIKKIKVCVKEDFVGQEQKDFVGQEQYHFVGQEQKDFDTYGLCPSKKGLTLPKMNTSGSNCPTPLEECAYTRYGCCDDNETAKIDSTGSDCPILDKNVCLGSKFGCCTGTIIPKQYLCDDDRDICKMTNCELNDNETGDPYAFYDGSGTKCNNNNMCNPGEMCVDGYCKKYNASFYNSLNGVKMAPIHSQSGNSMNNLLCGCTTQAKPNTKCLEEETASYEPVCGVDGKTYRTQCIAENSGIKVEYYGACNNNNNNNDILEQFYNLDKMKVPIKKSNTSYWILSLLLVLLVGSILYYFR